MLLLADTSAWIDHFRKRDPVIGAAITKGSLVVHEYVIAELALGSVPDRANLLADLGDLQRLPTHSVETLLAFVDARQLVAAGIGFVDASLLLSVSKAEGACLWTRDKRLLTQAERLGLAYTS